VQTGVVMVIYLEEAVERKRRELGGSLTRASLHDAVVEGALLRLRPKVMTVSTVVAGLLPIMWSTSVGAEVMKPLATPVLGGMVSSLIHVLIVTPVIFLSIRERQLGVQRDDMPEERPTGREPQRGMRVMVATALLLALAAGAATWLVRTRAPRTDAGGVVVHTTRAGSIDVVVRSPTGALRTGRNTFTIEFRSSAGDPVDVGSVRVGANMSMPGMVMSANAQVQPAGTAGRYTVSAEFGMAGAWPITVEWEGPAGRGAITFEGSVQ
jgi:Cu(I)/Ag(I) efflux system membrane protein CusA/SilA